MTQVERGDFDDAAPEADIVEQLIPVGVDDEGDALSDLPRVRISTDTDATEADLIDQAIVVPLDDESEFDR
ncbi:hypothetical protein A5731_20110 [Mycolicibacterium conceptionense]|jgi:hypothetical protein|uniref:Uncharacterized protein n=3 Tax=Mycolicibacterium TaxID=1866885 RepID=A0A0J8UDR2_9MYCO|nr:MULTISPECIES: hypothetical protein [Mycolicibacterium]KLI07015.1 hypothetical protein AA982_15905 [Mycolicibacterium senegalense]KLO50301.1 hypothetical protein ABW05_00960 [Mycolicibacterium senegalense]KMV19451.1 hypothetical protein ACT17_05095 [Mycolicibacterium conceptionense]MCW1820990.1 hypothetical protein [Mycolicibacterium senegalense]OBB04941.1 hypothetical protein A5718_23880 [Mycolicibacterium conceptionense]